jgi:hypothetical protein
MNKTLKEGLTVLALFALASGVAFAQSKSGKASKMDHGSDNGHGDGGVAMMYADGGR